jgi:hypothetical protein
LVLMLHLLHATHADPRLLSTANAHLRRFGSALLQPAAERTDIPVLEHATQGEPPI